MRLDHVLWGARDPAFVLDPVGDRFVAVNGAGCAMLGYNRAELLATPVSGIHPGELPQLEDLVARVLHDGHGTTITLTCRTRSGGYLPTEMALHAYEDEGRLYVLALVHDRSEHRGDEQPRHPETGSHREPPLSREELYRGSLATVLASWEAYARGCRGAAVRRLPGVVAAVFPNEPERTVYNNAILGRGLSPVDRDAALGALEDAYREAGVNRFAAWVHESDHAMRTDLARRGYTLDTSTRAMGVALDEIRLSRPQVDLGSMDWDDYLRTFGLPAGLLSDADRTAFHVLVARLEGENVATAMAFDHRGDCGIYNVATLEHVRRRGLATALTSRHLHAAIARGCRTASLQATVMADRLYATVGFLDLGRVLEFVPPVARAAGD